MGCVTATAKRRRRQAVGGFKHLPPQRRPNYATHTSDVWDRRAARLKDRAMAMQLRKGRKK